MQINHITHRSVCVRWATTVLLTHSLTCSHIFQNISACLCAGGLIHYSQTHQHSSRQNTNTLLQTFIHTHTHTASTLVSKSPFLYTPATGVWSYQTVQTASLYLLTLTLADTLTYTHTNTHARILCRHGGHWITMLPPGKTDRCVSVCVRVFVCARVHVCVVRLSDGPLLGIY